MNVRTWIEDNDLILWGALGCALVGTAHAEYTLAISVGANPWVAGAVPGALDLYVVRALQQGRDVFLAVLVMVAANVASYLVHSGDVPVDWRLRSAVGALAPLILWRVYSLKRTRTRKELLWGLWPGAGSAPDAPAPVPMEDPSAYLPREYAPGFFGPAPAVYPESLPMHPSFLGCIWGHDECAGAGRCTVYSDPDAAPDHVPDWVTEGRVHPSAPEDAPRFETGAPEAAPESAPVTEVHLSAGAGAPVELSDDDRVHLDAARAYLASLAPEATPSVRGLKGYAKVGQDRAERLLAYLETEES